MNLKVGKYSLAIVLGLVIVVIWGTSFLCSKVLVVNGMQPNEVYFLRRFEIGKVKAVDVLRAFLDEWAHPAAHARQETAG